MNILVIAQADHSGAGNALRNAVNLHTEHKCRAIAYKGTWLQYEHDIMDPGQDQLIRLCKWADVINVHDQLPRAVPASLLIGKPIVMTYHGSFYRNHWERENRRARINGYVQTALTIDLAMYGPRWIGRAMPDLGVSLDKHEEFTVVHSPTQPRRKGTALVKQACKELGVKLDVIVNVSNIECLRRKARGHVLVDQVGPNALGYGTSALEAWAMGMPVISSAPPGVLEAIRDRGGPRRILPFTNAHSKDGLVRFIAKYRDDSIFCVAGRTFGEEYLEKWHSPAYVAAETIKACEEAIACRS